MSIIHTYEEPKKRSLRQKIKTLMHVFKSSIRLIKKNQTKINIAFTMINVCAITLLLLYSLQLKNRSQLLLPPTENFIVEKSLPTKVSFPNNNTIELMPAHILDGQWQVADNKATYLSTSSQPGSGGNIVIYGHNTHDIFKPLHQLKLGDTITIHQQNNQQSEYTVKEIKIVDPENTTEVEPTSYEVLTLYTCTGLLDSKRLIVKAYPTRTTVSVLTE